MRRTFGTLARVAVSCATGASLMCGSLAGAVGCKKVDPTSELHATAAGAPSHATAAGAPSHATAAGAPSQGAGHGNVGAGAGGGVTRSDGAGACRDGDASPRSVGKPLAEEAAFAGNERLAVRAVRDELRRVLDDPGEYRAEVDEGAGLVVVQLIYLGAGGSAACGDAGSGAARRDEKSRTFVYDVKRGRLISTKWNQ